jgi:hypothetical protein
MYEVRRTAPFQIKGCGTHTNPSRKLVFGELPQCYHALVRIMRKVTMKFEPRLRHPPATERSLPHDQRPQEQRANAAQKAHTNQIKKAVKKIEKDRQNGQGQS